MSKKNLKESKLSTLEIAKEVGITLKNVRTFDHRRGQSLECDVYLNGKLLAHASDEGNGGCMHIEATFKKDDFDEMRANREIIQEVETAIDKYPEFEMEYYGNTSMMKNDLELIINALADDEVTKKEFNRNKKKGILFGDSIVKFKAGSIPKMIKTFGEDTALSLIQIECDKITKADKNIEILNKEYLESLGVKL